MGLHHLEWLQHFRQICGELKSKLCRVSSDSPWTLVIFPTVLGGRVWLASVYVVTLILSQASCPIRINVPLCVCPSVWATRQGFQKITHFLFWWLVFFSVWWPPASFVSPASNGGCFHALQQSKKHNTRTLEFAEYNTGNVGWKKLGEER